MSYSTADLVIGFAFAGLVGLFLAWVAAELMDQAAKIARIYGRDKTGDEQHPKDIL